MGFKFIDKEGNGGKVFSGCFEGSGVEEGDDALFVVDANDEPAEDIRADNSVYVDTGEFLEVDVIIFENENGSVGGQSAVDVQGNAVSDIGVELFAEVGAEQGYFATVVDLEEIGDFPLGEDGMFCAGIEDKSEGKNVVEQDIDDDKIIFVIERNIDPIQVFPDDDIRFLRLKANQPAKKEGR